MNQQFVGNVPALLPKQTARTFQVDCVPENDCSHYQIESAGSVALVFECPITQFTEAVKEYGTGQGVLGFSFVQTDLNPAAQIGTLQPFKGIYRPGKRTSDWLKIKARLQQEFVVGGFTAPKGSRKYLGAVVLGAYTKGKLRHYGYAGSGFSEKALKDAIDRMKPLFIDKCPFVNPPNIKEKIQWVRPRLVCEVEYAELTADAQLRQT